MKLFFALGLATALAAASLAGIPAAAQTTTAPFPIQQQTPPAPTPAKGKVIFSRSTDENGNTTSHPAGTSRRPIATRPPAHRR